MILLQEIAGQLFAGEKLSEMKYKELLKVRVFA